MKTRKLAAFISAITMLFTAATSFVSAAQDNGETLIYHVDSINGTRWADTVVVYKDIETDGQNQWGENIIIDENGIVTGKIPGGDPSGADLAVPDGGLILSGTGDIGREIYASAEIGDKVIFDEYTMNVYISDGEPDSFYTYDLTATGINGIRYSGTLIIYDKGVSTNTNVYGYEVGVSAEGVVVFAGGNDNPIPEQGYVISAIESQDIRKLKTYFTVGAKCIRNGRNITVSYDRSCLKGTVECELAKLDTEITAAMDELRLVDYDFIYSEAEEISKREIPSIAERNAAVGEIKNLRYLFAERRKAEIRAVWYTPVENSAKEIKNTVAAVKAAGFNELIIASNNSIGTFVPQERTSPFVQAPIANRLDVIKEFASACRDEGINITLLVSVMGTNVKPAYKEWLNVNSDGGTGDELFLSPANAEYRKAFFEHIEYILKHYDINGLQLDYIRYPAYYGGVDSGFDQASLELFKQRTGASDADINSLRANLSSAPKWNAWREFKTGLINEWVGNANSLVDELRPDVTLSAAVAASGGVSTYCQDPEAWFRDESVDSIYVMSYVEGVDKEITRRFTAMRSETGRVVMGIGAYISLSYPEIINQTGAAGAYGADGVSYFEWTSYKADGYSDLLASTVFASTAVNPVSDPSAAAKIFIDAALNRAKDHSDRFVGDGIADGIKTLSEGEITAPAIAKTIEAIMSKSKDSSAVLDDLSRAYRAVAGGKPEFDRTIYDVEPEPAESSSIDESSSPEYAGDTSGHAPQSTTSILSAPFAALMLIIAIYILAIAILVIKRIRKKKHDEAVLAEQRERIRRLLESADPAGTDHTQEKEQNFMPDDKN